MTQTSLWSQIRGLIRLTRWKEYIPFVIPATVVGALLAAYPNNQSLDWRLIMVTVGNILAVAYAFMINDIEDAPDDARDPDRAARNPITSGEIGVRIGYAACRLVAAVTLIAYALCGLEVFLIGGLTLLLSHLYSWRPVRLKAYPVTDILSHSLMLSGLLLLAGYYVYDNAPGIVWFVAAGASLISAYGQLYNQLRDYDMDKAAGLHNTAIMVGETNTRYMMYATIGLAVLCILAAIIQGAFPTWLAGAVAIAIGAAAIMRPRTDMRGGEAVEASGAVQVQFVMGINIVILIWLAEQIVSQFIAF
ncbi:MAG: UbiA family prenyltransferase [bacterium]|nr:UbiA family prenyltransferase [bacterium]